MKKVLIIPYFGKFPNYFQLFLNSCANNQEYDFFIFTDQDINIYKYHKNVKFITLNLFELQKIAIKKLKTDLIIYSPYKICDYRAAFGKIFEEYIKEYDFWGYCDIDLILGKISEFIPEKFFEKFDKFQIQGHLTLYRNNEVINNLFLKRDKNIINFHKVVKTPYPCFFDEIQMPILCYKNKIKTYVNYKYADVLPNKFNFRINANNINVNYNKQYFMYKDGKILRYYYNDDNSLCCDSFMYIHLQKRNMELKLKDLNESIYYINPNNFSNIQQIDYNNKVKFEIKYKLNYIKKIKLKKIIIKLKTIKQKKYLRNINGGTP